MEIVASIKLMKSCVDKLRASGKSIGFVPTMGALHEGHLSLIKKARNDSQYVVVSIFVNPIQFNRNDDLLSYPIDRINDHELALRSGVDFVFEPDAKEMYPDGFDTCINQQTLANRLCGIDRPGHFSGVSTVLAKLFNIIKPHKAYFGEKDFQQTVIVKRLVEDLNIDVKIIILDTVRDIDGIALSSRNRLLSNEERVDALCLYEALKNAKASVKSGVRDSNVIIKSVIEIINSKKNVRKIDYVAIVNRDTLEDVPVVNGHEVIVLAVWIGNVRLIDNCRLSVGD